MKFYTSLLTNIEREKYKEKDNRSWIEKILVKSNHKY